MSRNFDLEYDSTKEPVPDLFDVVPIESRMLL